MSKITIKFATVGVAIATVASLSGSVFAQTDAASTIAALQAQIAALQTQMGASASTSAYNFSKNLTLGSKGADVKALQSVLISGGYLKIAAPTTTFGPATKAAVVAWQKAVGISPASGYVGPLSRAKLNATAGAGTSTGAGVSVPSGTDLVVAKAVDGPADKTIGSGTAFNPALKVSLTAGAKTVKVTSLTVAKSGYLANSNLNGVDLVDSKGVRHGNVISSVGADNTILLTFPTDPVVIAAGQTETLTVRFNLASGSYTGTVVLVLQSVSSVGADTSAISGAFPISGATLNVVNGGSALAGVTLDVLTSTGSSTLNVDAASEQEMTKFRIQETTSNEQVKLYSWTLYNYGNAGSADYGDVQLVDQTGTVLATAQPVGQNIVFNLATPYLLDKGQTKDFTVKAKLLGGTTKTVQLVTYNNYDIDIRGVSTGVSVTPAAGSNDTSFPIGNGFNIQTIGSGTVTLSRAVDSPSAAVTPGTNDTVLASYVVKPTGENMELRQVSFGVAGVKLALNGTLYVKVNNQTVYSVAGSSFATSGAVQTVTLSTYPILTSGVNNTITVSGSVSSNATSADGYTVKAFDLIQAKRLVTNDLIDPGTSAIDGIGIAVQAGKLTVTNLSSPAAQSVVKGTVGYEFAQIQLSAQGSGEDVKVSKIVITDTSSASTDLTNAVIYKDSDTSPLSTSASTANFSSATNGTVSFTFQNPIVVTRATPVVLHVKADVSTGAGTVTHVVTMKTASSDVTAYGASTGNSVSGSNLVGAGSSQTQTVASSGSLTLSLVSGSGATPSADQVVTAGTSGGTYLAFKLTSQIETQKITSLKVTATGTNLATTTVTNINLYQDTNSTPVASAGQWDSCASNTCSVTFTAVDNILSSAIPTTGSTIYVKADVNAGGNGVTLGDSFALSIASASDIVIKGSVSAATSTATGTAVPTAVSYVAPQSVVVEAVSPTAATQVGTSAGQVVGIFKVTNNGSAPIYLSSSSPVLIANGGSATTTVTFELYASAQGGSQSDTQYDYVTGVGTGASSTISFNLTGVSEANRTINGGSFRYLTVKTRAAAANNDTFSLSVSALGKVQFMVKETDLGYNGNPFTNTTQVDTLGGMYTSGVPSLGTVTAKS